MKTPNASGKGSCMNCLEWLEDCTCMKTQDRTKNHGGGSGINENGGGAGSGICPEEMPVSYSTQDRTIRDLIIAVKKADDAMNKSGIDENTKTWVKEYLVPEMNELGLEIVSLKQPEKHRIKRTFFPIGGEKSNIEIVEEVSDDEEYNLIPRIYYDSGKTIIELKKVTNRNKSTTNEIGLIINSWIKEFGIKKDWNDNLHPADILDKYIFPKLKQPERQGSGMAGESKIIKCKPIEVGYTKRGVGTEVCLECGCHINTCICYMDRQPEKQCKQQKVNVNSNVKQEIEIAEEVDKFQSLQSVIWENRKLIIELQKVVNNLLKE